MSIPSLSHKLNKIDGSTARGWAGSLYYDGKLYGVVYSGLIYEIDPNTGEVAVVISTVRNWYGLAVHEGTIYGITNGGTEPGLYTLDLKAGTFVYRTNIPGASFILSAYGKLYVGKYYDQMVVIDTATYSASNVLNLNTRMGGLSHNDRKVLIQEEQNHELREYDVDTWGYTVVDPDSHIRNVAHRLRSGYIIAGYRISSLSSIGRFGGIFGNTLRSITPLESSRSYYSAQPFRHGLIAFDDGGFPYKLLNYETKSVGANWVAGSGIPDRPYHSGVMTTPSGRVIVTAREVSSTAVLVSDDVGQTFSTRTLPASPVALAVISVPNASAIGYRLVMSCAFSDNSSTIMVSDDDGETWTRATLAGNGLTRESWCLVRDPTNGHIFAFGATYASWSYDVDSEILRSTDNGSTWSSVFVGTAGGYIIGAAYDPVSGSIVAITTYGNNRLYRSTDHGASWTPNTTVEKNYWRGILWDWKRKCFLAFSGSLGDGSNFGMRSFDGGATWVPSLMTGYSDISIDDNGRLVASRNNEIRFSDNGVDFISAGAVPANVWNKLHYSRYHDCSFAVAETGSGNRIMRSSRHVITQYTTATTQAAQWRGIAENPGTGRIVIVGSTGGAMTSDDGGSTFTARASAGDMDALVWSVVHSRFVALGTSVAWSVDGESWASTGSGYGIRDACIIPSTGRIVGVSFGTTVYITDDGGATVSTRTIPSSNYGGVCYDPWRRRLIAVSSSGAVATSDDFGDTWTPRTAASAIAWYSVKYIRGTHRIIATAAVASGSRVMTSDDGGITWVLQSRSSGLSTLNPRRVDVDDFGHIVMACYNGIAQSNDNGRTWTRTTLSGSWFGALWSTKFRRFVVVSTGATVNGAATSVAPF